MKKTRIIAMGVAALVFIIAIINPFKSKENQISEEDLVEVVIAQDKIEQNVEITREMIEVKKIHKDAVPESPLTKIDDVLGKVALVPMFKDDIFIKGKVDEAGSVAAGLATAVEEDMRAITMNVEQASGISGMIRPGNKVDVISVLDEGENPISVLLLQDREVMAVDKNMNSNSSEQSEDSYYVTVTLSVTPEEAVEFSLAQVIAKSNHLALRNNEDLKILDLKNILQTDLVK